MSESLSPRRTYLAKRKSADDVASRIAAFIGKSMASLANRKDALQRELADVERQIATVRKSVVAQVSKGEIPFPKRGVKKAAKAAKRVMSPEARAKMAAAAKRRWAAAKKAGKTTLG